MWWKNQRHHTKLAGRTQLHHEACDNRIWCVVAWIVYRLDHRILRVLAVPRISKDRKERRSFSTHERRLRWAFEFCSRLVLSYWHFHFLFCLAALAVVCWLKEIWCDVWHGYEYGIEMAKGKKSHTGKIEKENKKNSAFNSYDCVKLKFADEMPSHKRNKLSKGYAQLSTPHSFSLSFSPVF